MQELGLFVWFSFLFSRSINFFSNNFINIIIQLISNKFTYVDNVVEDLLPVPLQMEAASKAQLQCISSAEKVNIGR